MGVVVDGNGNPIQKAGGKTVVDENGNPVSAPVPTAAQTPGMSDAGRAQTAKFNAPVTEPTQFEKERDPENHGGALKAIGSDAMGLVKSLPAMATAAYSMPISQVKHGYEDLQHYRSTGKTLEQEDAEQRQAAGYGKAYSYLTAPAAQAVGVDAKGMEHAADVGDTAGVEGHTVVPAATAVAPLAAEGVAKLAPVVGDAAKDRAYGMYNNVLGTKGKNMAYGANPGRGVAAEGVWGGKESLLNGIQDAISKRGEEQGQVLNLPQNTVKRIDISNHVNDPFVRSINNGVEGATPSSTIGRLQQTQRELTSNRTIGPDGTVQFTGPRNLGEISPADASKFKTSIYDRTKYNNPDLDEQVNNTLRQSAHGIRGAVEEAVPEVAPFNRRLSDLNAANNSLTKIVNNRMVAPTRSGFTEVAPAVVGSVAGGPVGAAAAVGAREMARMPAIRTGVAQGLYRFGKTLSPEEALRVPDPHAGWLNTPIPKMLPGSVAREMPANAEPIGETSQPQSATGTTRAERLGLLLPEKAGGKIEQPATHAPSPLWLKLQKNGEHP